MRTRRRRLIVACSWLLVAGLALAAGAAELGERWWLLDLSSHFRFHYIAAAAAVTLVALTLRRRRLALLAIIAAALHLPAIMHDHRAMAGAVLSEGQRLRLVSANVLWSNRSQDRLVTFVAAAQPDILVLQEATPEWEPTIESLLKVLPHVAPADWRRFATDNLVLSRYPLRGNTAGGNNPRWKPFVHAEADISGQRVVVVGVHPPIPIGSAATAGHRWYFEAIVEQAKGESRPVIVAGDFKMTPWSPRFRSLLERTGLSLVHRTWLWPESWPAPSGFRLYGPWPRGIPIDHVLISPQFAVKSVARGPDIGSDHYPLVVDLILRR